MRQGLSAGALGLLESQLDEVRRVQLRSDGLQRDKARLSLEQTGCNHRQSRQQKALGLRGYLRGRLARRAI
jgi:hypothetical protein